MEKYKDAMFPENVKKSQSLQMINFQDMLKYNISLCLKSKIQNC
jgi:hypothetical protein